MSQNINDPKAYMSYPVTELAREQNVDFSLLKPSEENQILQLNDVRASLNKNDPGYRAYFGRDWYLESVSPFFKQVEQLLQPKYVLDIGANHGVSSTIAGKRMSGAKVIAIEPIEALIKHIKYNLYSNMIADFNVINGVVGDRPGKITFAHNPNGSLDSRVNAPDASWKTTDVTQFTIEELTHEIGNDEGVYIKIDTQGYEPFVFKGGEKFFDRNTKWLIKSEFAPTWIRDQGSDPVEFVKSLIEKFDVYEFPERYGYRQELSRKYFGKPLEDFEAEKFVNQITNYFRNDRGWIDILVTPKQLLPI